MAKSNAGRGKTGMSGSPSPFAQWWAKPTEEMICKPRAKPAAIFRIPVMCCGVRGYEGWNKMSAGKK
jgi:hypothetical protein